MSHVHAPQFLVDLVRDLRDRRLLLPAALLAVALVAVPVLLSSSNEPLPPAPPSEPVAVDAGTEAQPAVLAENVTVRDYRKRLDDLKSRNPFESSFRPPKPGGGGGKLDPIVDPMTPSTGGGSSGATTGLDSTATAPTSGGSAPSSSSAGSGGSSRPEIRYFTRRIDVKVGEAGDLKDKDGVEQLTLLPSDAKPVVAFLGTSEDGDKAVFLVSSDVASTSGDGACIPSSANCQYLTMQEGESQTFDYTPDGKTYKLVLREIRTVRLDKAPDTKAP